MEMKKQMRTKKGILLTLLVVVLFVLMLGEVVAYVVINVNYDTLTQSASTASTQGSTATMVTISATSLLHTSLSAALSATARFEASPATRRAVFVNNSRYFLTSLMTNGLIYGRGLTNYMGTALMGNFNGIVNSQLQTQGVHIALQGGNISIYQGNPSVINASYTALALVNTTSGTFTVPISVSASVPLNGTPDIQSIEAANPSTISISPRLPSAVLVSGANAIRGTTGMFSLCLALL